MMFQIDMHAYKISLAYFVPSRIYRPNSKQWSRCYVDKELVAVSNLQ